MHSDEEILSFMDLLDLDEEVIDLRANNLMKRSTFTTEHLHHFIHLLRYKQLINIRENSECDNTSEYNFISKLITNVNNDNIDALCKIITTVLTLNPSSVIFKSEHLIQQILAEMHLPSCTNTISSDSEIEMLNTTLLHLKICGSIMDAVAKTNSNLSLPFLNVPLEYLVCSKDEKLLTYFLTNTVPLLFTTVAGYNILDRIWRHLSELKDDKRATALQVICCLSNYYLPVADPTDTIVESDIIFHCTFWDFVLFGLSSEDTFARKQSIYLAKRAIDYLMKIKRNINITSKSTFLWNDKNKISLKKMWDNFFILLDSLEEKQSNIVLPSLKLFENITDIGRCWLNCAFKIGLKHDNTQVRFKCLHYYLLHSIHDEAEAITILEAINDIVLFDQTYDHKSLMDKFDKVLQTNALITILKALPLIKWSPVPLYHVTKTITNFNGSLCYSDQIILIDLVSDLTKIPCNNIIIRKSIHINISRLIGNCCRDLPWEKYIPICSFLKVDTMTKSRDSNVNPFGTFVKNDIIIPQEDNSRFLEIVSNSHANIDFALLYYEEHENTHFLDLIDETIQRIENINQRQYSNKMECLKDVNLIAYMYNKSSQKQGGIYDKININASKTLKILLQYIISIIVTDVILDIETITNLFENLDCVVTALRNFQEREILLQLHKATILFLQDSNTVIDKKVLSVFLLNNLYKCPGMIKNYPQELLDLETLTKIVVNIKFVDNHNKEDSGRLRNAFYEKSCEIVSIVLNRQNSKPNNVLSFVDVVIESGGYGCLKWILKIMNRILPEILDDDEAKFDMIQFLNRVWREIEELKSNSQYSICMKEFVIMITDDALLKNSLYNNIVVLYCSKIIEYAAIKNMPLYLLVNQLNKIKVSEYSHVVYILSEILLNPVVARKESRIVENVLLEIIQEPIHEAEKNNICFNSHIQFLAVSILSKISDPEVLDTLTCFMIKKIEELFRNKQRYHSNSQLQRTLQACLQNLLFILLKSREVNVQATAKWCMEFLGRIPHQPFERLCLEWYISLFFYLKESILNEEVLNQLKSKNVPLLSQFAIMYWIVIHKLKLGTCHAKEFEFVMNLFLSNTMGPVFSIRLQAQYLSTKLFEANDSSRNKIDNPKYGYMINVINNTLQEVANAEDKSFTKLKNDYFVRNFDIVDDLIPCEIYWVLPRLAEASSNDIIEDGFLRNILSEIEACLDLNVKDKFYYEWKERRRKTLEMLHFKDIDKVNKKDVHDLEETGTIQKKYIPWKNMSDVDVFNVGNKNHKSELIVVASLIDKLPNLGGMARTSEVFGVQTYVVDSLRHLQDKQFQGLSVSAERWVTVEEVRPGQALKDYLMMKKTAGYFVVAAEQTSTSVKLQSFQFPKKTLLLLGNEKGGVPCDLLPLMDHCVEIPQQGVIRSLNVHVTAAIFVWEYARQNML